MLQMGASAGLAPEQASFLISMIGITNTVGRVAIGWVSDIPCVSPLVVNLVSLLISKSSLVFSNFGINEISNHKILYSKPEQALFHMKFVSVWLPQILCIFY